MAITKFITAAEVEAKNIGAVANLTTTAKDNLVNAINELKAVTDGTTGDLAKYVTTDALTAELEKYLKKESLDKVVNVEPTVADKTALDAVTDMQPGDIRFVTSESKFYLYDNSAWSPLGGSFSEFVTKNLDETIESVKTFTKRPKFNTETATAGAASEEELLCKMDVNKIVATSIGGKVLTDLATTNKGSLVDAINELKSEGFIKGITADEYGKLDEASKAEGFIYAING